MNKKMQNLLNVIQDFNECTDKTECEKCYFSSVCDATSELEDTLTYCLTRYENDEEVEE